MKNQHEESTHVQNDLESTRQAIKFSAQFRLPDVIGYIAMDVGIGIGFHFEASKWICSVSMHLAFSFIYYIVSFSPPPKQPCVFCFCLRPIDLVLDLQRIIWCTFRTHRPRHFVPKL